MDLTRREEQQRDYVTDTSPPTAPESFPNYLAEGVPKQDDATLRDLHAYVDELLAYRQQPVDEADLPDNAEPADIEARSGQGTVIKKLVTCGDE